MEDDIGGSDYICIDKKIFRWAYNFTQLKIRRATMTDPIVMCVLQARSIRLEFRARMMVTTAAHTNYQANRQYLTLLGENTVHTNMV
jgi:hypothetical protein